jgi:hypothetical protein
MANRLYPKGAQKILGSLDLASATIKAALLSSAYIYSASHEFLSDVSASVLNTAATLNSKSVTGGVFDASDVVYTGVATGATAQYVVLYHDTGTAGTSSLIFLVDTATGLPMATNGGDITVQWDNGANKIFALV